MASQCKQPLYDLYGTFAQSKMSLQIILTVTLLPLSRASILIHSTIFSFLSHILIFKIHKMIAIFCFFLQGDKTLKGCHAFLSWYSWEVYTAQLLMYGINGYLC